VRDTALVGIDEVVRLATELQGVRRSESAGRLQWRYQGRLVARQLDREHLVIRAELDYRDQIVRMFPATFSVPARFAKHMMVVADLAGGDDGAIQDALVAAWTLQRRAGPLSPVKLQGRETHDDT
jgi:hypothetical protein